MPVPPPRPSPNRTAPADRAPAPRRLVDRATLGALIRRHRRPLAAVCAGLAALVVLTSLTAQPVELAPTGPTLESGQVAMPVALATAGQPITAGTVLDIVAVPDDGARPWIVTRRNTVLEASSLASGGMSVLVAVTEQEALQIASATTRGTLTALMHAQAPEQE